MRGKAKKVIVSVINDLMSDRRVDRVCNTLFEMGFDVTLVGRKYSNSPLIARRKYRTHRMHLLFRKGPIFYAEYNLRLFLYLFFNKAHLLVSNDLDTLLPNYLVHQAKHIPLVYDTHEYFTGVPELASKRVKRNTWKFIEKRIFPKLKHVIAVNESIAGIYKEEYGNDILVVRNIPEKKDLTSRRTKQDLGLPTEKKIILLQGAGINIDRGAEEAIEAMQFIEGAVLVIIGDGNIINDLKFKVRKLDLGLKVQFIPRQTPEVLFDFTTKADVGLTLDKDSNINYRYSLPNKLFDYIHAGVPVLATPLVEVKRIIEKYDIGCFIDNHQPEHIADKMKRMLNDETATNRWKENLKVAAAELTWEDEKKVLIELYKEYV